MAWSKLAWRRTAPTVAPPAGAEREAPEPQRTRTRRALQGAVPVTVPLGGQPVARRDEEVALLLAGPWAARERRVSAVEVRLGAAAPWAVEPARLAEGVEAEPPGECRKSRKTCFRWGKTCDTLGISPAR